MSILIKGMNMPVEGLVTVNIHSDGLVYVHGAYPTELHEAVSVPTPHGRLKDGDMLESLIYERVSDLNYKADAFDILRIVQDMRPIIEAEEGANNAPEKG